MRSPKTCRHHQVRVRVRAGKHSTPLPRAAVRATWRFTDNAGPVLRPGDSRVPAERRLASRFGAEAADQWPLELAMGRPRPPRAGPLSPYGWAAIRPLDAGGPLFALGACTCDCDLSARHVFTWAGIAAAVGGACPVCLPEPEPPVPSTPGERAHVDVSEGAEPRGWTQIRCLCSRAL